MEDYNDCHKYLNNKRQKKTEPKQGKNDFVNEKNNDYKS